MAPALREKVDPGGCGMGVSAGTPNGARAKAHRLVRTLEAAVRAGRPETARGGARLAQRLETLLESLALQLETYLEEERFLRLQVTSSGLRVAGEAATRQNPRHTLAASLLHAGDVVDLVFKQGVARDEILRLAGVLHRAPFGVDEADSIGTMLWESDLRRISFRCRDDLVFAAAAGSEIFDSVNIPMSRADELAANTALDAVFSAGRESEAFPDLDLDEPTSPLRRVFQDEPGLEETLRSNFPTPEVSLQRVTELLTGVQLGEEDAGTKALAREALLRVVDLHLGASDLEAVRQVLRKLRPASAHAAVYSTLRALGNRICSPTHVPFLAAILDAASTHPAQNEVVQDILRLLGDEGMQPLWRDLPPPAEELARTQWIAVLAALCADNPQELAQCVATDSWEGMRDFVDVLARIGGARVLTHLSRCKRHRDARVRYEVARALVTNDQQGATAMLCELLEDDEQRVRQAAVWALAARGDVGALPKLRETILETSEFRERSTSERDDFFRALGRLADEEMLGELVTLLEKRSWTGKGWTAELRRGAAIALGDSRSPQARRLLEKYARSRDGRLREACRHALHSVHEPPAGMEDVALDGPEQPPREETQHVG